MIEVHSMPDDGRMFIQNKVGFFVLDRGSDGSATVYGPAGDGWVVRAGEQIPPGYEWVLPRTALAPFMAALARELGAIEPTRELSDILEREAGRVDRLLDTLTTIVTRDAP